MIRETNALKIVWVLHSLVLVGSAHGQTGKAELHHHLPPDMEQNSLPCSLNRAYQHALCLQWLPVQNPHTMTKLCASFFSAFFNEDMDGGIFCYLLSFIGQDDI